MNKSTVSSFNLFMFLALALCTNIAVAPPPAMAETCMTEDLLMVYEPVVSVKPKTQKARKVAVHKAVRRHVSVHALRPTAVKQALVEPVAANVQVAVKRPQGKTHADDSEVYVETKDVSSMKKIGVPNHLSST